MDMGKAIKWAALLQAAFIAAGVATMFFLSDAGMEPQDAFHSGLAVMLVPLIVIVVCVVVAGWLL